MEDNEEVSEIRQQEVVDSGNLEIISRVKVTVEAPGTAAYSQPRSTVSASSLKFAYSSNTNEWRTPPELINVVRKVLRERIELDPASSRKGNEIVQAERYYSIAEDGLAQPWNAASVFINPPYGRIHGKSQAGVWSQRLIVEYTSGNVQEAILLVNASTSESWFQPLYQFPLCFTNHRIRFNGEEGKGCAPTKGSVFVYFGRNPARFARVFEACGIGTVVSRYRYPQANRIDDVAAPKLSNQSSFYSKTTTNE